MNRNPSPKSEFLKNKDAVAGHTALLDNPYFMGSLNVALFEYQRQISMRVPADNFNACASGHLMMVGAQDFINTLLNLAETAVVETRKDVGNLPGNVSAMPRKN